MKKLIFSLPVLLLFLFFTEQVQAQSPAQAQISQLKTALRTLNTLSEKPNWSSPGYRSRYKSTLDKSKAAIQTIREKDTSIDLSEQSQTLVALEKAWNANGKAAQDEADAAKAAKWEAKEKEKAAHAVKMEAEKQERLARIAQSEQAAAQARNAQQEQYKAAENQRIAETKKQEAQRQANTSKPDNSPSTKPAGTVEVKLKNTCSLTVPFCIDEGGSQTYTRISPNETSYRHLKPGTKICRDKNGQKGGVIGTISKSGQIIYICR